MEWFYKLNDWINEDLACAIITIIEKQGSVPREIGAKMCVNENGETAGTIGGGALELESIEKAKQCIKTGKPITLKFELDGEEWLSSFDNEKKKMICGGSLSVFIEPINTKTKKEVVMFGGGHIAEKLAKFCDILNIPYRVYDDRPEYVSEKRFENAKELVCAPFENLNDNIKLTEKSYCVIMTYGHSYDETCLEILLKNKQIPYIGMIGSKGKVASVLKNMKNKGLYPDNRIYSPIGLYIGRNLPEEIALSVISEIMLLMEGGKLSHRRLEAI